MNALGLEHHLAVLCPFEPAISPFADQVQRATMCWARDFGLARSARARAALDRLQYGSFMARAYPNAALEALQLIADWNTWLFLLDDAFDEQALGREPAALARFHAELLDVMRGVAPSNSTDTRLLALQDLTCRFRAQASPAWMRRFTRCVAETFEASVWEARNRVARRVPSEAEYLRLRPFTSAVFGFLCFIEVAEQIELPPDVRHHPTIQALTASTNNIISWFNDLISYPKEMARGDVHNLVAIVHWERGLSLEHAAAYVARKHDAEVRAFKRGCASPPEWRHAQITGRYLHGLQTWIRANVDWSIATARYRPTPDSTIGR